MSSEAAIVLFSGGQDSTACLAWALERYPRVETLGFDFGQRHSVELEQRRRVLDWFRRGPAPWRDRLGEDFTIELSELAKLGDTALTHEVAIEMDAAGLPTTFVPGRNLLFFTYAAAYAYRRNITALIGGMCETDYSGYPDCRNETIQSLESAISLGMDKAFQLITPLMFVDKAGTWQLLEDLGGDALIDMVIEETHTCYLGDRSQRHDWGYGCGTCPACELRAKGYVHWRHDATSPNSREVQSST